MEPTTDEGYAAPSVLDRAMALLGAFQRDDVVLSLADLRERTGIPRATVHRLAGHLAELGLLERGVNGYRLGIRLFELGERVPRARELRRVALPHLHELLEATRANVHLGVLEGIRVLYIEKLSGRDHMPLPSMVGDFMPAHATALGKVLLAFSPPEILSAVLSAGLEARTPFTITVPRVLVEQLIKIRSEGVGWEREESALGVACVAAPLYLGREVVAAVSVSYPVGRYDPRALTGRIRRTAEAISAEFDRDRACATTTQAMRSPLPRHEIPVPYR
jgi:DNA-binding IclR family transcriptional regulator